MALRKLSLANIQLAGRPWEEVSFELQRFLEALNAAQDDDVAPTGFEAHTPEEVQAGVAADPGPEEDGWASGTHRHAIETDAAIDLQDAPSAEGTGTALARAAHIHKRDVRAKKNGTPVATRNALDFRDNTILTWTLTDDPGNDEVDVLGDLANTYKEAPAGATVKRAAGLLVDDAICFIAPYACDVIAVKGIRRDGTGATINMRRNFTSEHLASDLSLPGVDTLYDGGAVQNVSYAVGDIMEARVKSVAGSPTHLSIVAYVRRTA
jgi:hypothetical protein